MSLIRIVSILALIITSQAQAAETVNLGAAGRAGVTLEEGDDGASLSIVLPGGKVQEEAGLGQEFVPMALEGRELKLIQIDLDKDGAEEFLVRGLVPPQAGAVFVYKFSGGKFVLMPFGAEEQLMVDAAAPVRVGKDGKISADIVSKSSGKTKIEKLNWAFENGKFVEKK